jgi:phosphoribosyl 1,2-cyclic phosphate phosphodiesterase
MKLTILGTGTSLGVPQLGCNCAVCRSDDPRDRRTRTGAVIETDGGTRLLIDVPPELRVQLLAAGIDRVDAVFITHEHADHTHGIDDIRAFSLARRGPIPVYASRPVLDALAQRFAYVFDPKILPLPGSSKPEADAREITPWDPARVGDATVEAVEVLHGPNKVLGFRVGPIAYVTDAKTVPGSALARLRGVSVLVLNALRTTPHPTHLSVSEAVQVAREVGAKMTWLTHLTHDQSHAELAASLPEDVQPAYDGLTLTVD